MLSTVLDGRQNINWCLCVASRQDALSCGWLVVGCHVSCRNWVDLVNHWLRVFFSDSYNGSVLSLYNNISWDLKNAVQNWSYVSLGKFHHSFTRTFCVSTLSGNSRFREHYRALFIDQLVVEVTEERNLSLLTKSYLAFWDLVDALSPWNFFLLPYRDSSEWSVCFLCLKRCLMLPLQSQSSDQARVLDLLVLLNIEEFLAVFDCTLGHTAIVFFHCVEHFDVLSCLNSWSSCFVSCWVTSTLVANRLYKWHRGIVLYCCVVTWDDLHSHFFLRLMLFSCWVRDIYRDSLLFIRWFLTLFWWFNRLNLRSWLAHFQQRLLFDLLQRLQAVLDADSALLLDLELRFFLCFFLF